MEFIGRLSECDRNYNEMSNEWLWNVTGILMALTRFMK